MKKLFTLLFFTLLFVGNSSKALPVATSTYNLPTARFNTLKSIIDTLNAFGITGTGPGIIININTAYKTESLAPYILGSSILNPTIGSKYIQINGNGLTLNAHSGTGSTDAIFAILGTDNVAIDGIKFVEAATNTTATSMMEWGVAAVRLNANDGVKTLNVTNCQIALNKLNATAASGFSPNGSTGIFVGNCSATSTAALAPASSDGVHDGFYFYKCHITNVTHGIYAAGNKVTTDGSAFNDKFLTISTDTIENFLYNGVSISNFNLDQVTNCNINNMSGGGAAPTANMLFGIRYFNDAALQTNTSWTCKDNNIDLTINTSGTTYAATGIFTQINGTGTTEISTDTVKITSTGASAQINGIYSQNVLGTQKISKNLINDFTTTTTNAQAVIGIYGGGYSSHIGLGMAATYSVSYYLCFPTSNTIDQNTITNFNVCSGATNIANPNRIGGIFYDNFTTSPMVISKNVITKFNVLSSSVRMVGIGCIYSYNTFTIPTIHTTTYSDNIIDGITTSNTPNTTNVIAMFPLGSYPNGQTFNSTNNKVRNIASDFGNCIAYVSDYSIAYNMDKDTITGITSANNVAIGLINAYSNPATGSSYSSKSITVKNCLFNTITSNSVTGGFFAAAISIQPGTVSGYQINDFNFNNNVISKVSCKDPNGSAIGINTQSGPGTFTIYNNMISDIENNANVTTYASSIGINLPNSGTNNVAYNTVNMNTAAAAASGFSSTALVYNGGASNKIQNNILRVNVTAGAANNVAAIRGLSGTASSAPSLAGFTASSNIYYTPTGLNNYLYVDGTTNASLVNGYHVKGLTKNTVKNIVNDTFFNSTCDKSSYHKFMQGASKDREKNTYTEDNLTGTGGVFSPAGTSYAEGFATDLGAVGIDFKYNPRPFGSSDIGALQFAGKQLPRMEIIISSSTGLDTACPYNLPTLRASIPAFFKGKVKFQWYRGTTAIAGAKDSIFMVTPVSGSYFVTVYDTTTGCTDTSTKYKMTVVPPPPAIITYYDSLTFCETSAIVIQANKGPKYTYSWYYNGGIIPGETDDHLVVDKTGEYSLEVNTPLGCATSSTPIRVKVYPNPKPVVAYFGPRMLTTTQKFFLYQWYKNNVKISDTDATNRTLYIKSDARYGDGAYSVEVTDSNGCTAKSDTYLFSLGINESIVAAAIKIFPNPATDVMNIESPITINAVISDLAGRAIIRQDNAKQLQLGSLSEGMYLLTLSDKDGKLIKVEKINKIK